MLSVFKEGTWNSSRLVSQIWIKTLNYILQNRKYLRGRFPHKTWWMERKEGLREGTLTLREIGYFKLAEYQHWCRTEKVWRKKGLTFPKVVFNESVMEKVWHFQFQYMNVLIIHRGKKVWHKTKVKLFIKSNFSCYT